jgi:hypothetical protein
LLLCFWFADWQRERRGKQRLRRDHNLLKGSVLATTGGFETAACSTDVEEQAANAPEKESCNDQGQETKEEEGVMRGERCVEILDRLQEGAVHLKQRRA